MVCPLTRERQQKKNPIFIFKSVRVRLQESLRLRECVNTEFDWGVKRGFEKAAVSRAVRLRECPLANNLMQPFSYLKTRGGGGGGHGTFGAEFKFLMSPQDTNSVMRCDNEMQPSNT